MRKDAPINLRRKRIKYLLQTRFRPKVGKTTYIGREKSDHFLIIDKIYFFLKPKCYKSKIDTLHTLNLYKIPAQEHQLSDH